MDMPSLPYAQTLIQKALQARQNAYAPYSHFHVGAAVLTMKGNLYTGCNIENASFGAGICAERAAISAAVTNGETQFTALAVAAGETPVTPCGICRQFLREFGNFIILSACITGEYQIYELDSLLPHAFTSFTKDI